MELSQALENIKHVGDKFAKEEVLCIRENKEAAIPVLLDIVCNIAENFDEIPDSLADIEDPLYSMFLLAEFRVNEAFDPILRLLEFEEDKCRWLLSDLITEEMDSIIASVATADDVSRMKEVVENTALHVFQRTAPLKALIIMYSEGNYPRTKLIEYIGTLFEKFSDDIDFITWIICDCKDISAIEYYPLILEMFKQGKVLTGIIGTDEFARTEPVPEADILKRLEANPHIQSITDTVKSMHRWHCFKENQKPFVPKLSAVGNKKVGRNDFCPCGSGKKYKKCCLNR